MVRSRFSSFVTFSWTESASPIWSPTVWSGEKEVIGSWKIMPMRLPRMWVNSLDLGFSLERSRGPLSVSLKAISPPVMRAVRGKMPIDRLRGDGLAGARIRRPAPPCFPA